MPDFVDLTPTRTNLIFLKFSHHCYESCLLLVIVQIVNAYSFNINLFPFNLNLLKLIIYLIEQSQIYLHYLFKA